MDKIKKIAELIHETKKKFGDHMREDFKEGEMTLTQGIIVYHIHHLGNVKISDLSDILGLSNSTVSGIVDRLEKKDLVRRERSSEDRRVVHVKLTDGFIEKHKTFGTTAEKIFGELFSDVDDEDIDKILTGLSVLNKVLDQRK